MGERTPQITVIGGGAGSHAVLSGLKQYPVDVHAVVNMADNGGSSGELRDKHSMLPPGDVRRAIAALSEALPAKVALFETRYPASSCLAGHAIGNLLLAELTEEYGDFERAVSIVSRSLSVKGDVVPATFDIHDPVADISGHQVRGECQISQTSFNPQASPPALWLEPDAKLHNRAARAIETADMIVVAPGDLYGSLAPPLLLSGVRESMAEAQGRVVYVSNLVNKAHQTAGFTPGTYARELERIHGEAFIDDILYNTAPLEPSFVRQHGVAGEQPVEPVAPADQHQYRLYGADVVSRTVSVADEYQPIQRSHIRHDPQKVSQAIMQILSDAA